MAITSITTLAGLRSRIRFISGIKAEFEAEGEFYGEERLEQVFKKNSNLPADELCRKIREDLFGFCGTNQQKDDITIVAIKSRKS